MTRQSETPDRDHPNTGQEEGKIGFLKVMGSVMAAAFGVRSRKFQERDFQSRSAAPFIVGGILFTLLFVGALVLIVNWVMSAQGS